MKFEALSSAKGSHSLIGPKDPPPYTIMNEQGSAKVLLVGDHVSNAIPEALNQLGLEAEILKRGTSAHRQINVYEDSLAAGADEAKALKAVVDMLISESAFSVF